MPPSIPTHDASTGGASTHLPLIHETSGTKHSTKFAKSSTRTGNGALRSAQRSSSSSSSSSLRENRRVARGIASSQRSNKQKELSRKTESNRRPSASPFSSHRQSATTEESRSAASSIQNEDAATGATSTQLASSLDATGLAPYGGIGTVSPYGLYGGASMMMPPSPYLGMNTMGGMPYLSGLNQIVYNVQNIIFSITQAVYVVGANQQALQQAWESLNQMVDHAVATFHEMRALDCMERAHETEEEKQKRKRLKALRYAFVFGGGWLIYKLIRNLLFRKRTLSLLRHSPHHEQQSSSPEGNYYGQSPVNYYSTMTAPSVNAFSSYSSSPSMGYPGYSGNYHQGGNGYY